VGGLALDLHGQDGEQQHLHSCTRSIPEWPGHAKLEGHAVVGYGNGSSEPDLVYSKKLAFKEARRSHLVRDCQSKACNQPDTYYPF